MLTWKPLENNNVKDLNRNAKANKEALIIDGVYCNIVSHILNHDAVYILVF